MLYSVPELKRLGVVPQIHECHWPKDDDFASPIWMMDQCHTNANAVASSGGARTK
jgi:hypothetical protein